MKKKEAKVLDSILEYFFNKNSQYEHIVEPDESTFNFSEIAATRNELKEKFNLTDKELNKYLQIMWCKNEPYMKFISRHKEYYFIMDKGIEFYYLGGFLALLRKAKRETYWKIIIAVLPIIISIIAIFISLYK